MEIVIGRQTVQIDEDDCTKIREYRWHLHKEQYDKYGLGYFTDIEDVAKAYAEASKKYHGEFRRLV